jgi:TonB family protein
MECFPPGADVALAVGRVKAAAARHAVWTVVMAGMLLYLALATALPPIPVRLLPAASPAGPLGTSLVETAPPTLEIPPALASPALPAARSWPSWRLALAAVYGAGVLISLLRLAFGYGFTRRLVREARPIDGEIRESSWISVPMTVGWLHPQILLPAGWREWDKAKLDAVLAHERWHIRRADWAIASVAAINRSLFWFHPLAWWLERTLLTLAEQSSDDAALLETADRAQYAQVLWEMAAAVRAGRGRMVWETMAMAKNAEVHVRIERILDETRKIPVGPSRRWYAGLLACSLPLMYAAGAVQVARALTGEQPQKPDQTVAARASRAETPGPDQAPKPAARQVSKAVTPAPAAHPSGTDPTPAPETPAPQQPEAFAELTPVTRVAPNYPRLAQVTGAKGTVEMIATVGTDGHVRAVKLIRGGPMLQKAATDAVMQWVYDPQPAETQTLATVTFLGNDSPPQPARGIQQAVLISKKDPEYPQAAREAGAKGIVELVATIGTDGRVKAVKVVHGPPMLQEAASDAVMQWRYRPTMLDGAPVEAQTQVFVNFLGEPPAPAQPLAAPADAAFQPAELISRREPIHPSGSFEDLGGTVVFQARIGLDGRLSNIRVTDGPAELVPAALEAVKQWIYRPAKMNGQPIESDTRITVPFPSGR